MYSIAYIYVYVYVCVPDSSVRIVLMRYLMMQNKRLMGSLRLKMPGNCERQIYLLRCVKLEQSRVESPHFTKIIIYVDIKSQRNIWCQVKENTC